MRRIIIFFVVLMTIPVFAQTGIKLEPIVIDEIITNIVPAVCPECGQCFPEAVGVIVINSRFPCRDIVSSFFQCRNAVDGKKKKRFKILHTGCQSIVWYREVKCED